MALRTSKRRPVGTWSAQRRQDAMEQSREAARGPMDLPFLLLTLLLTAMGMVMVLSASFPSAYYENGGNGAYYFIRQNRALTAANTARAFSPCWALPLCSLSAS